jgi:hypothetical protein
LSTFVFSSKHPSRAYKYEFAKKCEKIDKYEVEMTPQAQSTAELSGLANFKGNNGIYQKTFMM